LQHFGWNERALLFRYGGGQVAPQSSSTHSDAKQSVGGVIERGDEDAVVLLAAQPAIMNATAHYPLAAYFVDVPPVMLAVYVLSALTTVQVFLERRVALCGVFGGVQITREDVCRFGSHRAACWTFVFVFVTHPNSRLSQLCCRFTLSACIGSSTRSQCTNVTSSGCLQTLNGQHTVQHTTVQPLPHQYVTAYSTHLIPYWKHALTRQHRCRRGAPWCAALPSCLANPVAGSCSSSPATHCARC
jgi:hypothetical protein